LNIAASGLGGVSREVVAQYRQTDLFEPEVSYLSTASNALTPPARWNAQWRPATSKFHAPLSPVESATG
jgi:hypothetical protein